MLIFEEMGSLRSKRSRTTQTKFGPREGVFHIGATGKIDLASFFTRPNAKTPSSSRSPNFIRLVRERLLRRLGDQKTGVPGEKPLGAE